MGLNTVLYSQLLENIVTTEPKPETNIEEVSSQLRGGLETCRSVIDNYRTLLTQAEAPETPDNDDEDDGDLIEARR